MRRSGPRRPPWTRAALVAALSLAVAVPQAGATPPGGASIVLNPVVGPPTTVVRVRGSGFGPGETVDLSFDQTAVGIATSDDQGGFRARITVPASALPGSHQVGATGESSGEVATAPYLVRTDWPQFHLTVDHRGYNPYENVLSPATAPDLVLKWQSDTGSHDAIGVTSSAAVVGGIVYTAGSFDSTNIFTEAFDVTTGTMLWQARAQGGATGDIAVVGGRVYVSTVGSNVIAYDATTGAKVWEQSEYGGPLTGVAASRGLVYAGDDAYGALFAFNGDTGAVIWKQSGLGGNLSTPAVAGSTLYIGSQGAGAVIALDAGTGAIRWRRWLHCSVYSSPAVVGGLVYVGTVDTIGSCGTHVYALDAGTGAVVWRATAADNVDSSASVAYGTVYIGSDDGNIYAFDATTGTQEWTFQTGSYLGLGSPVAANGVVYTGSTNGSMFALDAQSGQELWTYQTGGPMYFAPAIADGSVYIGSRDGDLYAFRLP